MPTVTLANQELFYLVRRSADSEDSLLFIHGAGGTHRHWGSQVQGLKGVSRYAVDLPGHGRSKGEGRTSIPGYAEVIIGLLDALALDQVTLVGHSMGGAISQYFALNHASRVNRLVLVGTGARLRVLPSLLEGMLRDFPSTVEMMLNWAYYVNSPPDLAQQARDEWLENDPQVVHDDFAACDVFDVMDELAGISCPTLVVCGQEDKLTPTKYAQYLRDNIPGATLTIIPQAGHMVMMEQPDLVNEAIRSFLIAAG